jgi:hypothetical protein
MLKSVLAVLAAFVAMAAAGIATDAVVERTMGSTMILATLIVMMTVVNLTLIPTALPLWWKVLVLALALSGPFVLLGGWLRSSGRILKTE